MSLLELLIVGAVCYVLGVLSGARLIPWLVVLRSALRTAERWGLVTRNAARRIDGIKVPRHEIEPLTPEQARVLIESSADDRFGALWVTALATGMRQGELLALRWGDVDLDSGLVSVRHTLGMVDGHLALLEPKTQKSRRTIVLPAMAVSALRAHRTRQLMERLVAGSRWADSGHVFTTMVGTPVHAATITRAFQAALARAGLPRSRFHDLRHAAATFLLAQGMTLQDVKQLLGHSSISDHRRGRQVACQSEADAHGCPDIMNVRSAKGLSPRRVQTELTSHRDRVRRSTRSAKGV